MATYYFELIEEGGTVYVIRINELSIESFNIDDFVLPHHTHTKSDITDLEEISVEPKENAIPKADENGKISLDWINAEEEPTPNAVPKANDSGRIKHEWLDVEITSEPTPDAIPKADSSGRISLGWLDLGNLSQHVSQYKYKWLFHPEALKDIEFDIDVLDVIKLPIPDDYPGDQVYGEFIHVDLVYNPNGILAPDGNKYPFWIAYSPYPSMQGGYENPCVAYSKDGITWRSDFTLPLIAKPRCKPGFMCINSDPDIFELDDGRLCLINRVQVKENIFPHLSGDSYSLKFMIYTPGSGWSDPVTFATSSLDVLKCPSVVKDPDCKEREFVLFTTQAYTNLRRQTLTFSEDYSSATIGNAVVCNVIDVDTGEPVASDHINIRFLNNQYVGIILDENYNLYWAVSIDGYTFYAKKIIFNDEVIGLGFPYRADFIVQEDGSILLYLPFAFDYSNPFLLLVKAIPRSKTDAKSILQAYPIASVDIISGSGYSGDNIVYYYLSFVDKSGKESNKYYIGQASSSPSYNVSISINGDPTSAYKYKLYRSYNSDSMLNITDVYSDILDPGTIITDDNTNWVQLDNPTTIVGTGGKIFGYDEEDNYIFTNKGIKVGETTRPPFVVESTELVENLNADLLDGKHADEFPLLSGSNIFTGTNTFGSSVAFSVVSTSSNLVLTDIHHTVLVDASDGNIIVTLPSAEGIDGRIYIVKKVDDSFNSVVIQAQEGQYIDGMSSVELTCQYAAIEVQAFGGQWYIISKVEGNCLPQ